MSNRTLVHSHYISAELIGEGALSADTYPMFPRPYLWAHLDDGIMEAVTTNWVDDDTGLSNSGIRMDMVGPALAGRWLPGLGPVGIVGLGGALYFDANGNITYDPTALQNQINTIQAQQTTDVAQIATLLAQVATLQAQVANLQTQITDLSQIVALKPTAQASFAGVAQLSAILSRVWVTSPLSMAVSAALQAALQINPLIGTNLAGSGGLVARFSGPGQLSMPPLAAAGSFTANAYDFSYLTAAMTGACALQGALTSPMPIAPVIQGAGLVSANLGNLLNMRGLVMAGAGGWLASLNPPAEYLAQLNLASAGNLSALLGQQQQVLSPLSGSGQIAAVGNMSLLFAAQPMAGAAALIVAEAMWPTLSPVTMAGTAALLGTNARTLRAATAHFAGTGSVAVSGSGFTDVPGSSAWDPANIYNLTLSNANKTVTSVNTTLGNVLGTKSHNTGKYYFEVTVNTQASTTQTIGVATSSFTLSGVSVGQDPSYFSFGIDCNNGVGSSSVYAGGQGLASGNIITAGNVIGVAVDSTGTLGTYTYVFISVNGAFINGPVGTQASGNTWSVGYGSTVYPAYSGANSASASDICTINTGGSAFAYALPSGYVAWG